MKFAAYDGILGHPPIQLAGLVADAIPGKLIQGMILPACDPWWGTGEFIYAKASGAIRMLGLCMFTPVFNSTLNRWEMIALEVTNTANLGKALCVALNAMADTQFGWFMVSGLIPVNCNASVAADVTFGIAAAGQGGANTAGKQVLNARIVAAGATTVAKTNAQGVSGALSIVVQNTDGWFVGMPLSGTGIGASCKVASIAADDRTVTVTVANSAAVSGTVTGTYNDGTIFYNVAHLNRPFAQGAIT